MCVCTWFCTSYIEDDLILPETVSYQKLCLDSGGSQIYMCRSWYVVVVGGGGADKHATTVPLALHFTDRTSQGPITTIPSMLYIIMTCPSGIL